jgi:hypothetical protein
MVEVKLVIQDYRIIGSVIGLASTGGYALVGAIRLYG